MTIQERVVESMVVLDLSGRLTLNDGDAALKQAVSGLLGRGSTRVLLNVADVEYVDSAGLGALVATSLLAKKAGGSVKLLQPSKRLHDLLAMSRLLALLEVCESETDALQRFSGSSALPSTPNDR